MITKTELEEVVENLTVRPVNHSLLVLVPKVSEKTESGIIKGESVMKDEEDKLETFLPVIAVAKELEGEVKVGDRVYIQGNITTFSEEMLPDELNIAPDGYTIGHTLAMYIRMIA